MSDTTHQCEYLKYKEWTVELVHPGTEYQRRALLDGVGDVVLQVVMFCPYCGEDFRAECHWQIPGRPQENAILAAARKAAEPEPSEDCEACEGSGDESYGSEGHVVPCCECRGSGEAEPAESRKVALKSVERTVVGSRLNDRTWFRAVFDGEPSEEDIKAAQSAAHYSPWGYGGPWKIKRTENEDGTWTAEWCCAGSCD
jgi:hypothetical protein